MNPKTINSIIKGGFKSEADVKHFFTELRVMLEYLELAGLRDYLVIKFYADWMLHINKDNLRGMHEYFNNLNEILNRNEIMPDRHEFNKQIESFTSFVKLREQLNELFAKFNISHKFVTDQSEWKIFCSLLTKLILKKPIKFDQLKTLCRYRKMTMFVVDDKAPFMIDLDSAIYWMLFINTSDVPLIGIIPESIGLNH